MIYRTGFIHINAGEGISGIEIYNLTGKRISRQVNHKGGSMMHVALEGIETGLYMLRVSFKDDSMTTRKIIVK